MVIGRKREINDERNGIWVLIPLVEYKPIIKYYGTFRMFVGDEIQFSCLCLNACFHRVHYGVFLHTEILFRWWRYVRKCLFVTE